MRLALITGGLFLSLASAAQATAIPVQPIPSLPSSCSTTPYGETCLHVFGGAPTRIPLPSTFANTCNGAHVQLYQLSTRLVAPVGGPVALSASECSSVTLNLPDVKEETSFRVSLLEMRGAEEERAATKNVLIQVYPNNLWDALRDWSTSNHLVVNDRDNRLTPILDQQHIAYTSSIMSSDNTSKQQVCVWVPQESASSDDEPPVDCKSLLVLYEKTDTLPIIHVQQNPHQVRTDVHMPILNALSTNPLVQKVFASLIQSQL